MKNVIYSGNLEEDINTANSKFVSSKVYKKMLPYTAIVLAGILATYGFDNISLQTMIYGALGTCAIYAGTGVIGNTVLRKNYKAYKEFTENYLEVFAEELSKNPEVNVTLSNLKETVCEKDEVISTSKTNYKNNTTSKIEKVIKYFYLLDEEDQIQVLKQIATMETHDDVVDNTEYETFLLEEEDLKGMHLPVRRTLTKK